MYFPEPEKIWHICAEGKEEEEERIAFQSEGLKLRFTIGHPNLGGFYGG